jgi:ubiquinone/menaquinone biosynthesis C-methylase UbiE
VKVNATNTSALLERILSQKDQSVDLNEWVFDKLKINANPKILELCCGTGAQTKYLVRMMGRGGSLDCLDINEQSISANRNSVAEEKINYHISDIDAVDTYAPESLDLIFSSYGFYYSKDPVALHEMLYRKFNTNGKFVLVGPVLGNNSELYEIMKQIGVKINDDVLYSSEKFMLEMEEIFLNCYGDVHFHRALNKVRYGSVNQLLKYWKNTTFHDSDKEKEFISAATNFYSGDIVVTKSISYLEGVL